MIDPFLNPIGEWGRLGGQEMMGEGIPLAVSAARNVKRHEIFTGTYQPGQLAALSLICWC